MMGGSKEGQGQQMSDQRPTVLVLLAFAASLGALAVAAASAWLRCGRGSACSSELALAIVAVAPACLIGVLMVLLLRTKVRARWLRSILLAGGVGVAVLPLAAFLLRDVVLLPVFAALVATTVLLVLWGERSEPETAPVSRPPSPPTAEERPSAASDSRCIIDGQPPAARPHAEELLAIVHGLAVLNDGIIRLCELLTLLAPAPAGPEGRRPPYR